MTAAIQTTKPHNGKSAGIGKPILELTKDQLKYFNHFAKEMDPLFVGRLDNIPLCLLAIWLTSDLTNEKNLTRVLSLMNELPITSDKRKKMVIQENVLDQEKDDAPPIR